MGSQSQAPPHSLPCPSSQIVISLGSAPLGSEWPLKPAPSCPSTFQLVRVLEESMFMGRLRGWQEPDCLCQEHWPWDWGVGPVQLV